MGFTVALNLTELSYNLYVHFILVCQGQYSSSVGQGQVFVSQGYKTKTIYYWKDLVFIQKHVMWIFAKSTSEKELQWLSSRPMFYSILCPHLNSFFESVPIKSTIMGWKLTYFY